MPRSFFGEVHYNNSFLNQNFDNNFLFITLFSITLITSLLIAFYYFQIKCEIKEIENNFKKFHRKILQMYKEIGLDVDSLG